MSKVIHDGADIWHGMCPAHGLFITDIIMVPEEEERKKSKKNKEEKTTTAGKTMSILQP